MKLETINHFLQFITKSVDERTGETTFTSLNGNFIIVANKCTHNLKSKSDLMNVWKKSGYITNALPTHISIHTYYTDCNGNCYEWYNITHKLSDDKKRIVINFDYLKEWNESNINELVAECLRLYEMDINPIKC